MRWFRYVRHDRVAEFEQRGWVVVDNLEGSPHAAHAVLMGWAKDGDPD